MASSGPVTPMGPALSRVQLEAQYQVQTLKKQNEIASDLGKAAIQLINTALAAVPNEGHNVNTVA